MKFSIIIPVRNAQETLKACLDSVFASHNKDFEVIVVDDASNDESANIARKYPCKLITLDENKKPAYAKNIGRDNSTGEVLVFIDADVVIKGDTLDRIEKAFIEDKNIVAMTSLLSKKCPHKGFFTQYKNLYMHFIFKRCAGYIEFLYGSLAAIKKEDFLRFDEGVRLEDTELGQRYKALNRKIILDTGMEVTHLKKYNFKKILKNDFFVPFWWVKSFILHKGYRDILTRKRFAHARLSQLVTILTAYLMLGCLFFLYSSLAKILFSLLLFLFLILNYKFFAFLYHEKGFVFLIKSIAFTILDLFTMGLGIFAGLVYFFFLQRG